ncbi:MAG: hypothetical protein HKN54_08515 [Flavobacteriaceae bacterium]|nr:hypothetical protein [Flavobacteriaceae bacterium]
MKVLESNLKNHVIKSVSHDIGDLHFFNHFAIIEFSEGQHVTLEASIKLLDNIQNYFGDARSFGIISNRVNSYSMQPMDVVKAKERFTNLAGYGVVANSSPGRLSAHIEDTFCTTQNIKFNNLYEAVETINSRVKAAENID